MKQNISGADRTQEHEFWRAIERLELLRGSHRGTRRRRLRSDRVVALIALLVAAFALIALPAAARAVPVVESLTPSSGGGLGGYGVKIKGHGLAKATTVYFGPYKPVSCAFPTDELCEVAAPRAATAGEVDVQVEAEGVRSAITPADRFTYLPDTRWFVNGSEAHIRTSVLAWGGLSWRSEGQQETCHTVADGELVSSLPQLAPEPDLETLIFVPFECEGSYCPGEQSVVTSSLYGGGFEQAYGNIGNHWPWTLFVQGGKPVVSGAMHLLVTCYPDGSKHPLDAELSAQAVQNGGSAVHPSRIIFNGPSVEGEWKLLGYTSQAVITATTVN